MTEMESNPLTRAWGEGRQTLGIWCAMPSATSAELIARQGVDYVCVDYQHGLIDHSDGVTMMVAVEAGGATPIARVGRNDPFLISQALDAGAQAVVVPMVNDAEAAQQAVRACRYPPRGERSYGPVRAQLVRGSSRPEDVEDVACIVMVETAQGIANVAEIAATPGVDAIYVGPTDLTISLGLVPFTDPPDSRLTRAIDQVVKACRDSGIAVGIQARTGPMAQGYVERGFDMVTVGMDTFMLTTAVQAHVATARGTTK